MAEDSVSFAVVLRMHYTQGLVLPQRHLASFQWIREFCLIDRYPVFTLQLAIAYKLVLTNKIDFGRIFECPNHLRLLFGARFLFGVRQRNDVNTGEIM